MLEYLPWGSDTISTPDSPTSLLLWKAWGVLISRHTVSGAGLKANSLMRCTVSAPMGRGAGLAASLPRRCHSPTSSRRIAAGSSPVVTGAYLFPP